MTLKLTKLLSKIVIAQILTCLFSFSYAGSNHKHEKINSSFQIHKTQPEVIQSYALECAEELDKITIPSNHQPIDKAFRICLSHYIKLQTISPQGNEEEAILFLEVIFKELGFPYKIFAVKDLNEPEKNLKRYNLLATLPRDKSREYDYSESKSYESIILTHHMDVVTVNEKQWDQPELVFSGKTAINPKDGREYIYGRGALDMKGIGIAQLISMILVRNSDINQLNYDLHYLALSDEEAQGSGALGTLKLMNDGNELEALKSAKLLLNEGGGALKDVPKKNQVLNVISAEQKGGAWLELTHDNLERLIWEIHRGSLIPYNFKKARKNRKKYKIDLDCEITNIESPVKKVNVVSSELTASFSCPNEEDSVEVIRNKIVHTLSKYGKGFKISGFDNSNEAKDDIKIKIETSSASHGSLSLGGNAVTAFALGIYELGMIDFKSRYSRPRYKKRRSTFATKDLLNNLKEKLILLKTIYLTSFLPGVKNFILSLLESNFEIKDLFRTSCQFTNLYTENGKFKALIDCRLLHTAFKYDENTSHAEKFLEQIKKRVKEPEVDYKIISGWNFSFSKIDTPEINLIKDILKSYGKENVVTTFLFPAGTDSTYFRTPKSHGFQNLEPIASYGFFPIVYSPELAGSIHGSNERFPTDKIISTNLKYFQVVKQLLIQNVKGDKKKFKKQKEEEIKQRVYDRRRIHRR